MTTIFERVKTALDSLNPAVAYGMSVYQTEGSTDLPDTFIVYTVVSGVKEQSADNAETYRTYRVQLSVYSRSGLVSLPDVDTAMLAQGFTKGPERQLPYDAETHHFGLAKDYFYLQ